MSPSEAKSYLLQVCQSNLSTARTSVRYGELHSSVEEVEKWEACVEFLTNSEPTKVKKHVYGENDELPETD